MGSHSVIVVGAGVSGCACAAELAARGILVTLLNGSLDSLGTPGYGPDVLPAANEFGVDGWSMLLDGFLALPSVIRHVWLGCALVPAEGGAMLLVDRRRVSVEAKWALEQMETLRIRQGLVTAVRPRVAGGRRGVEVETVFGEVLHADACVLAVGLALGGVVHVGEQELGGGRYAEVPADALRDSLVSSGVALRRTTVRVGVWLRFPGDGTRSSARASIPLPLIESRAEGGDCRTVRLLPAGQAVGGEVTAAACSDEGSAGREHLLAEARSAAAAMEREEEAVFCRPPSPYAQEEAGAAGAAWAEGAAMHGDPTVALVRMAGDRVEAVVAPDGLATGEWYVSPGFPAGRPADEAPGGGGLGPRAGDSQGGLSGREAAPAWERGQDGPAGTTVGLASKDGCKAGADTGAADGAAWVVTRPEHEILSWVIEGERGGGPLAGLDGTWVCGQAAGCGSYLESLVSGAAVGRMVAEGLG